MFHAYGLLNEERERRRQVEEGQRMKEKYQKYFSTNLDVTPDALKEKIRARTRINPDIDKVKDLANELLSKGSETFASVLDSFNLVKSGKTFCEREKGSAGTDFLSANNEKRKFFFWHISEKMYLSIMFLYNKKFTIIYAENQHHLNTLIESYIDKIFFSHILFDYSIDKYFDKIFLLFKKGDTQLDTVPAFFNGVINVDANECAADMLATILINVLGDLRSQELKLSSKMEWSFSTAIKKHVEIQEIVKPSLSVVDYCFFMPKYVPELKKDISDEEMANSSFCHQGAH